jgi:hypothetical protein
MTLLFCSPQKTLFFFISENVRILLDLRPTVYHKNTDQSEAVFTLHIADSRSMTETVHTAST